MKKIFFILIFLVLAVSAAWGGVQYGEWYDTEINGVRYFLRASAPSAMDGAGLVTLQWSETTGDERPDRGGVTETVNKNLQTTFWRYTDLGVESIFFYVGDLPVELVAAGDFLIMLPETPVIFEGPPQIYGGGDDTGADDVE